ncbi:HET-domain-containing protein [Trichodelitschia bisporula]|uniref:HET-domain-containing protein n=1 Tax=Trichodelitschia bisporula TaxID=703511 RepID=A0A6G1HU81_9PEZI|nr:HET-domain-containing protein [Trichodelitschia bisporula]
MEGSILSSPRRPNFRHAPPPPANMDEPTADLICPECAEHSRVKHLFPCSLHPELRESDFVSSRDRGFLYEPILPRTGVRFIQFEDGPNVDEVRCSLVVKPLSEAPAYNALSYTWGDPTSTHTIICNGQPVEIRQNLFAALRQIRKDGRTELLWADALCINQAHNVEKSKQVKMMGSIYQGADLVIAYIGEKQETDAQAFALMSLITLRCGNPSIKDFTVQKFRSLSQLRLPPLEHPDWAALFRFLYRPYFFRIWIVQEILLAEWCIVQCGDLVVDRDILFGAAGAIETYHCISEVMHSHLPNASLRPDPAYAATQTSLSGVQDLWSSHLHLAPSVSSLWFLRGIKLLVDKPSLLELLNHTRLFNATEPRDKIFALVNLAGDINPSFVEGYINYDKPLADVQIDLAKYIIRHALSSSTLWLSYVDSAHHSEDLPSWVPDWTSDFRYTNSLGCTYYLFDEIPHVPVLQRVGLSNELYLIGQVFDTVGTIIHQMPYLAPTTANDIDGLIRNTREMEGWDDACWELATTLDPYPTGEHIFDAYWRTLIFNREERGVAAPADMKRAYSLWASVFGTFNEFADSVKRDAAAGSGGADPPKRSLWSWWEWLRGVFGLFWKLGTLQNQIKGAERFSSAFRTFSVGRKFFASKDGLMGWVPATACEGDVLCYFQECQLPFVLRRIEGKKYRLVGDAYLHGYMHERPPALEKVQMTYMSIW